LLEANQVYVATTYPYILLKKFPATSILLYSYMSTMPTQSANWLQKEEQQLAKSWLKISKDPIVSTVQKRVEFYKNVVEDYNNLHPPFSIQTGPQGGVVACSQGS
jgi:hypothetical protein